VAQGYETQRTIVDFEHGVVAVRLGKTPPEVGGDHVDDILKRFMAQLPGASPV